MMNDGTLEERSSTEPFPEVGFGDVQAAASVIEGHIEHTPCRQSITLSEILGTNVFLKFENQQFTASFKERGALNKLVSLTDSQRDAGILAMSAGNHAQAVAYHARRLEIPATIVMPTNTPFVKVENTRSHQAEVILHGDTLAEASAYAHSLAADRGATFIHPFDDPRIIAGQGTVALEMLATVPELDCLVIPVGGGGLISGMAVAARAIKPGIEIVGVEAALYPSIKSALDGQKRRCGGDTLAEGIAVTEIGHLTLPLIRSCVDDMLLVGENDLEHAVCLLLNIEKTLVEGAGAAGLAAIAAYPEKFALKKVGIVLSGGNIDSRLLSSILMRELVRDGRITQLRVNLSDVPGQMAKVSAIVCQLGGNFIEIRHQRIFTMLPAKDTYVDIILETRDRKHLDIILQELRGADYTVKVLEPDAAD
jgi:threonine dehydratase